jgi:predicted RNA-binding protein with PUA-like domain
MNYWLVKTEPTTYSWSDMLRDGKTRWDGVRNFQARNNIGSMQRGDLALFYHSVSDKSILGVVKIASAPYADPSLPKGASWLVVDVEPAFGLREPVTLERIKEEAALRGMVLLKQSRLSVQPVKRAEFERVVSLGGKTALAKR